MDSQYSLGPKKKRKGPPPTGKGREVKLRLHSDLLDPIDAWISEQREPHTRQQAIYKIIRDWSEKGRKP